MEENHFKGRGEEIVFGSAETRVSAAISRDVRAGRLRRLAPRLYSPNTTDAPDAVIRRNLYPILAHYYPGAVVSHRSALEGGVARDDTLFLTHKYTKRVSLPGITIRLLRGPGRLPGDTPFMGDLYLASRARALLENLQPSRARHGVPKNWSLREVEDLLDEIARIHGEDELNRLRDQARTLAPRLGLAREFKVLDGLVGALLGSRSANLTAPATRARARGVPYDPHRLARFTDLFGALHRAVFPVRAGTARAPAARRNAAFFEAYFSNYIEGTEFEVEEAADIVFRDKAMPARPADAHDIRGTFRIVSDAHEMQRVPSSGQELLELLQARHATLLAGRPGTGPGQFKEKPNRAGETLFVAPDLVRGTLVKGYELMQSLDDPLARAMYMMFLVAEVHPFADGNGRVARVMMNAELEHGGRARIIIPTVYREDYLLALRALTRQGIADGYMRMLSRAHEFTAGLDFSGYEGALAQLRGCNAFLEPHEGLLKMPWQP